MTPGEKRANVAGYIDAATTLIDNVAIALQTAAIPQPGIPRTETPPAMFEQLAEVKRILMQCAEWMLSPHNSELEKKGG
jgi:hypothetical protein